MGDALRDGVGIAGSVLVMLYCAGQFVRKQWPGLLFWFGAALGACVGQALVLVAGVGIGHGGLAIATTGGLGVVIGMLGGGMLADLLQERQEAESS